MSFGAAGALGVAVAESFENLDATAARLGIVDRPDIVRCDLFDTGSCAAAVSAVSKEFNTIEYPGGTGGIDSMWAGWSQQKLAQRWTPTIGQ